MWRNSLEFPSPYITKASPTLVLYKSKSFLLKQPALRQICLFLPKVPILRNFYLRFHQGNWGQQTLSWEYMDSTNPHAQLTIWWTIVIIV